MRALRSVTAAALLAVGLLGVTGKSACAQDVSLFRSPVLVVESERLYRESAFGRRIADEISDRNAELAAENRRIEDELEAEELDLTELRPTLAPEEFRELADAFDRKVVEVRREQEIKARAIARGQEENRTRFLEAAAPVLEEMMRDAGAAVVLERRNVFLSLNAIDITDDAITRIDEEIGDGSESGTGTDPEE